MFAFFRNVPAVNASRQSGRASSESGTALRVLLGCIAACGLLVLIVFSLAVSMVKRSPAYAACADFVKNSPEIQAMVGKEIRLGWVPRGSILGDAGAGSADVRMKASGPKGSTRVEVLARSRQRMWYVVSMKYTDGDGATRTVLPPVSEAGWGGQNQPPEVARHAEAHAADAFARFRNNDFRGAISEYDQAIQANPHDPELYYWRGVAFDKAGDQQKAIADFRHAIELNPTHIASYEYVDPLLHDVKAWDMIVVMWSRLIELQPDNGMAYYYRAGGYLRKNDRAAALADERRACDLGYRDACRLIPRIQ